MYRYVGSIGILFILLLIIGKFSFLTVSFEPEDIGLSGSVYDVISVIVHLVLFYCVGVLLSISLPHILWNSLPQLHLNAFIILVGIVLACGSEYLQVATSRDASLLDLGWNILGIILGITVHGKHKLCKIRGSNSTETSNLDAKESLLL